MKIPKTIATQQDIYNIAAWADPEDALALINNLPESEQKRLRLNTACLTRVTETLKNRIRKTEREKSKIQAMFDQKQMLEQQVSAIEADTKEQRVCLMQLESLLRNATANLNCLAEKLK